MNLEKIIEKNIKKLIWGKNLNGFLYRLKFQLNLKSIKQS